MRVFGIFEKTIHWTQMFIWLSLKETNITTTTTPSPQPPDPPPPHGTHEFPLLQRHTIPLHLSYKTRQWPSWESQTKNRMSSSSGLMIYTSKP